MAGSKFQEKYEELKNKHIQILESQYGQINVVLENEQEWLQSLELLKQAETIDEYFLNDALADGKRFMAEGAQGTLLDIDFGSYPYVTSSNTIAAGAFTGLGVPPNRLGRTIGIFKAYCTRVGSGPFPTELFDVTGDTICKVGKEYGSTTGRKRRCGWLDLVALKYAIMINGVTELAMMKADVLDGFDKVKICTHYLINGEKVSRLPFGLDSGTEIVPVYKEFSGWDNVQGMNGAGRLPVELSNYINFIESETGVKVSIVSTGPDRSEISFQDSKYEMADIG